MYFVYIIRSVNNPDQIYVGCTKDLEQRLVHHNSGSTPHTANYKPWKLIIYIAFDQKDKAYKFEEYLKSGSGREFRNRRFL